MKYVIDIPEEYYEVIKKIPVETYTADMLIIANGTPLDAVLDEIRAEINSPNRGTCDYFIVDRIEEIINKYKAESEDKE